MKDRTSDGRDLVSIYSFLQDSKAACDTCNIQECASMWLLKHYLNDPVDSVNKVRPVTSRSGLNTGRDLVVVFQHCQLPFEDIRNWQQHFNRRRWYANVQVRIVEGTQLRPTVTEEHVAVPLGVHWEDAHITLCQGREQIDLSYSSPLVIRTPVVAVRRLGAEGRTASRPSK